MTCHNSDLGSVSDWLNQISYAARPIRSTTQIWLVKGHQYGMSALVPQTPFGGKPVLASWGHIGCFLRLQISAPEIAQLSSKSIRTKKRSTSPLFLTLVLSISATAAEFFYLTHLRKHSIIRVQ